jgi:hypothetical protein
MYTVTYKGKIIGAIPAETKWHAIAIMHNNAIAAGFSSNRQHYEAFPNPPINKSTNLPREIRGTRIFHRGNQSTIPPINKSTNHHECKPTQKLPTQGNLFP